MRRLTAAALAVAVAVAGPWAGAVGAAGDGGNQGGWGEVEAGSPVAVAVRGPSGELGSYRRSGGGAGPRWTCGLHAIGTVSSLEEVWVIDPEPIDPVPGRLHVLRCHDEAGAVVHERYVLHDPADPFGGLLAAERAAELARSRLALPAPVLVPSPPAEQLVGVPTWLAVADRWEPLSATASVSSVTATVTATPVGVTWSTGDGATVACAGPGQRFDPGRPPGEQASSCTHTYQAPSADQPGGAHELAATVTYRVSWSATDGGAGDLDPVTRTAATPVQVVELQAIGRTRSTPGGVARAWRG